jgi:uncharacterized membrane protein
MKCPRCQRENPPASRFCIYCGSPLPIQASPASIQPVPAPEAFPPPANEPPDEIRRLGTLVAEMNERLRVLEQKLGMVAPVAPHPAPPAIPSPLPTSPTREATPRKPREWEQILGGNWLARIGIVLLIIGAGFFLKFAFDQNWLGPAARVLLGVVAGLGCLGGGYCWRRRYPTFAQALSGGGIALLYLSIFAAFVFFHMLNVYLAVGLLFLISCLSAVLATRQNSMALAIIGILGAFLAPFLLGALGTDRSKSPIAGYGLPLLVYIVVVDLGVLALSAFRNWRWFVLLAFFGSLLTFGGWYWQSGHHAGILAAEGSLTILFLIFAGATVVYHVVRRETAQGSDYALMVLNAAAYFGISYGLLHADLREWLGGFTLLLALSYGGVAYFSLRAGKRRSGFGLTALGIALAFFTLAVPLQFRDSAWTTIAWAAEMVALMWLSLRLAMPLLHAFSYGVFVLMGARLLLFDTRVSLRDFQPFVNERFLAFFVAIAATYLTVYLLWRARNTYKEWAMPASTLLVAANCLTLWVLSFEIWNYFSSQLLGVVPPGRTGLENARNLSLTALWALYALVLLIIGMAKRWRAVRLWALGLLFVPIAKVFVYDVWALETLYRIIAFVGLGLLLLAGAYLYQRYGKAIRGFIR